MCCTTNPPNIIIWTFLTELVKFRLTVVLICTEGEKKNNLKFKKEGRRLKIVMKLFPVSICGFYQMD